MTEILVFGYSGQVATALRSLLSQEPQCTFLSSIEANFNNTESVIAQLARLKPKIIINASAYTQVDKAEDEKDLCFKVNATTPGAIAEWCLQNSATLIHYSTDYVFDGSGTQAWIETDQANPTNWYGFSKLEGENKILNSKCRAYILRVSWVYSPWGQNFYKTIFKLCNEREQLNIVNDQWGSPTDARDIAESTIKLCKLIQQNQPPKTGIYHLRFSDYSTWYDFALKIAEKVKKLNSSAKIQTIKPISSAEYPTKATRPKNSKLSTLYNEAFTKIKNAKSGNLNQFD